jgi:hypothetical protein
MIGRNLRMMETPLGLLTKCSKVVTVALRCICHVLKLLKILKRPAGSAPATAATLPR